MAGFFGQERRPGDPPGEHAGGGKNALTSNLGPLPVWGWALVVIGAIVLYRKMTGGASSASSSATPSYPVGTNFGELYLANSPSAPTAPSTPSTPAPAAPTDTAQIASAFAAEQQQIATLAQQLIAQGAGPSNNPGLQQFFARNTAMKELGVPYFTGANDPTTGQALVVNPQTGQTVPLGELTAIGLAPGAAPNPYTEAVQLGRADAWRALTSGQTTWAPAS